MSYTEFLLNLGKSTDGVTLFLAEKTKNIQGIDHLVEKGFLLAVFKRLEMAAKDNHPDKIIELKRRGLEVAPIEYIDEIKIKMEDIIKENSPVLLKRQKMSIS